MIEIKYLQDLKGADRYGTCGGCGMKTRCKDKNGNYIYEGVKK